MKLRRALVAAATTAAIAPVALSTAAAAYADGPAAPTATASAGAADEHAGTATGPTPTASTTVTGPNGTGTDDGKGTGAGEAPAGHSGHGDGTAPGNGRPATGGQATTSAPATPAATPTPCDASGGQQDPDSALQLAVTGLPGKVVAGSGWHAFTLTAANPSDNPLGEVKWFTVVDNLSTSQNEKDWLLTHTHLQFFDAGSHSWLSVEQQTHTTGIAFSQTSLGAHKKVDIPMRVTVDAKAPAGAATAIGFGAYLDTAKNCVHQSYAEYDFTVLAAGSKPAGGTGQARPNPTAKPPAKIRPQTGGVKELPATGTLAETGSPSQLPQIAAAGAAAVVIGAAAIVLVRRRSRRASA
ncbi:MULTISPECIES: LAETG motif-containing sortase-dependent surface protein [Streptomycetaceae]|uniref:Integral membrane protein n=1 Tax=Streptantibioticus cattleyicolor (strain ATCC 35852 / DSM 46488 / JCM 4925 / NBRC 14057 / NRRL 8057) TaxID=1003195 RepID=F8JZF3_STREN|nr:MULTISPECIES: LAETG motif-containing sortase-dependent surface protein [Streptomycetaceae]AEW96038.1 integral membrane protein [Streptantibioticus cattleyicolor NRRL 8057 = DSM 46488]MYS60569.1 hypothetical protein [Streptomyces sp. SID5468]CCB76372.1 putative Predicted protein [Streptantibioticus cattleyicolor NRRL 8057 = DSM 46488]